MVVALFKHVIKRVKFLCLNQYKEFPSNLFANLNQQKKVVSRAFLDVNNMLLFLYVTLEVWRADSFNSFFIIRNCCLITKRPQTL